MKKHLVYKISFLDRIRVNNPPYYYIGYKSNAKIIDNKIFDKNGNIYKGSSKFRNYSDIYDNSEVFCEILGQFDTSQEALDFEKYCVIENNAKKSKEYFNLEIPSTNTFCREGYGTFKRYDLPDKVIRLSVNDELVLNGTYVGATKGNLLSIEARKNISNATKGSKNPFFGKKHSEETLKKISMKNKNPSEKIRKIMSESAKRTFSGVRKTANHREKISKSNMDYVTLKNINTLECIRIKRTELNKYDMSVWKNPYSVSAQLNLLKTHSCKYCGFSSTSAAMIKRWHNDNCKRRQK